MSANGPGADWVGPGTGSRTNGATAPPVSGDLWRWVVLSCMFACFVVLVLSLVGG